MELSSKEVEVISNVDKFIRCKIQEDGLEDAFYTLDISCVEKLWNVWQTHLPMVKPFYAVKCNPNPTLISVLSKLGAGFDVATMSEMTTVLNLGVSPEDLIFANPCKMNSHIRFAQEKGVNLTTFDSASELPKLKAHHPGSRALIRIRVNDHGAKVPLGAKFGAELNECPRLLALAKESGIDVIGVSFHVGSGAKHAKTYKKAIKNACIVFDIAASLGLEFSVLDIGGGFVSSGGTGADFTLAAKKVNFAISKYFPPEMKLKIIAEPGRFFAEEPFTLAVNVFGSRFRVNDQSGEKLAEYWINDGIFGSMSCVIYEQTIFSPRLLFVASSRTGDGALDEFSSTLFGPTCDSVDTVMKKIWLPELACGDWIIFPRMGAYSVSASTSFNGFSIKESKTFVVRHQGLYS